MSPLQWNLSDVEKTGVRIQSVAVKPRRKASPAHDGCGVSLHSHRGWRFTPYSKRAFLKPRARIPIFHAAILPRPLSGNTVRTGVRQARKVHVLVKSGELLHDHLQVDLFNLSSTRWLPSSKFNSPEKRTEDGFSLLVFRSARPFVLMA
jgi:hypothetical protein